MKISDRKVSFDIEGVLPCCISSAEEMLLFDIETTGLKKEYCRIYLIGCAYFDADGWHIRQWLTESAHEEAAVLEAFAAFACGFKTLVTFNGEGFDIPVIDFKNRYYGTGFDIKSKESLDIYKKIKPLKKLIGAESLSQKSVERLLKIEREDLFDGGKLIPYYYEYEITKSEKNERLLLLHNFEDVLGMGKILPVLNCTAVKDGLFEFSEYGFEDGRLNLKFTLPGRLPFGFENGKIRGYEDTLLVSFETAGGRVLIPLKNPGDYYYLPEEDTVIHKDLAAFVGRKYKKKASAQNCFLKVPEEKIPSLSRDDFKSYAMNIIDIYS